MSYAAPETPLPLSTQQKGLSPEGFIPGNCVHEVMTGIGGRLNEAKNKAGVGFMAERNIRARMTCLRCRT